MGQPAAEPLRVSFQRLLLAVLGPWVLGIALLIALTGVVFATTQTYEFKVQSVTKGAKGDERKTFGRCKVDLAEFCTGELDPQPQDVFLQCKPAGAPSHTAPLAALPRAH